MDRKDLHRMIRVDQAGEFGATRIYEGQLAVMGDRGPHSAEIRHMAAQEAEHRRKFDALLAKRVVLLGDHRRGRRVARSAPARVVAVRAGHRSLGERLERSTIFPTRVGVDARGDVAIPRVHAPRRPDRGGHDGFEVPPERRLVRRVDSHRLPLAEQPGGFGVQLRLLAVARGE